MCPQDDEFLARLLVTFREEAADHLQVIISGILSLEKDPDLNQSIEIEPIFRATHSLKGAARAVGLKDIETVCQHLESVFSAVRKDGFILHSEEFDLIHEVISALEKLLAGNTSVKTGNLVSKLKKSYLSAKSVETQPGIHTDKTFVISEPDDSDKKILEKPIIIQDINPPDKETKKPKAEEINTSSNRKQNVSTIRISEERLTSLYETADDLLSYRLSSATRLTDLKEIAEFLRTWRWNMSRVEGDIANLKRQHLGHQDLFDRIFSFVDTTRDLIGSCETKLDSTIKSMKQDQYEIDSVITGLIENIKEVVLIPVSSITDTYQRMIRDIAREQRKQINLSIIGSDIEIDRRILEVIKDPIVHLLRNAVDHGIEIPDVRQQADKSIEGVLSIKIIHNRANQVMINIYDDGMGIDPEAVSAVAVEKGIISHEELTHLNNEEKINLIFRSGFTTSKSITTVSGRGLGLAIVQEKINQIGGVIELQSIPGKETTFTLTVPITLATFRGILIYIENRPFFLPLEKVERVIIPDPKDISTVEGRMVIRLDNQIVPVAMLSSILGLFTDSSESKGSNSLVLMKHQGKLFGLIVSQIAGAQEIVVRNLGPQLREVPFINGVAILNNTLVVPVLQVDDIAEAMQGQEPSTVIEKEIPGSLYGRRKIMVAEDSITSRMLLKNILEGAGYDVETAVDGLDAFTRLKTTPVDLLVSDVDMPRMNGFVLTEKIRSEKKLSDLPVILVTSLDSQEDREHGITVGANAYIIKSSFDQGNLLEVIKKMIGAGK